MSESLASRVGRLISGSMNAMLDAIESRAPEAVMQEAIREIDRAVEDVRAELGRCLANKHMSGQRLAQLNARHTELAEQVETAVTAGKDHLARVGIAAQLDIEGQLPVLERTIADEAMRERDLESYIVALQAKKHEMTEEVEHLRELRRLAGTPGTASSPAVPIEHRIGGRVDQAVGAFDRVAGARTGLPASGGVNLQDARQLAELEALTRTNRIDERLSALKSQARN